MTTPDESTVTAWVAVSAIDNGGNKGKEWGGLPM
jgi:hypothetical protein